MHFMAVRKSRKRPGIVVYSYFKVLDRRADPTLINFVEYPPPSPRSMLLVDNTLLPSAVTRKFLKLCYYFALLQPNGFNKN